MVIRKKADSGPIVIDLTGPQGNAYVLLGTAQSFCKQIGFSSEETQKILDEMMSSDYENLLEVFDREFGSFVILER
jgi:hypothetical protein